MDAAEARRWIERYTAADSDPVLSADEVEDLLGSAMFDPGWLPDTAYPRGSMLGAGDARWSALYGGITSTVEPTWTGTEVVDGSVTWLYVGSALYDLHRAAAEGWELKAAKIAANYDFAMEGGSWDRSQAYDHAVQQADRHRGLVLNTDGSPAGLGGGGRLGMVTVAAPSGRLIVTEDGLARAP